MTVSIADGVSAVVPSGSGSSLPDQSGNAGKLLTTNGTTASWVSSNYVQNTLKNPGDFDNLNYLHSMSTGLGAAAYNLGGTNIIEFTELTGLGGRAVCNIGIEVTTATAGGALKAALYTVNSSGNFEIISGSEVTLDGTTTGLKFNSVNFTQIILPYTPVFVGVTANSSTIQIRHHAQGEVGSWTARAAGAVTSARYGAHTYGTMPSVYNTSSLQYSRASSSIRAVLLRI